MIADIAYVPPDLRRLDELKSDALALGFFENEKPLKGALGVLDWRFCGLFSRLLLNHRITGTAGEVLLLPGPPKIRVERLFIFGLGPQEGWNDTRFSAATEFMLKTVEKAGTHEIAIVLPGRQSGQMEPEPAMKLLFELLARPRDLDRVTIVDQVEHHKSMVRVVETEKRRMGAAF